MSNPFNPHGGSGLLDLTAFHQQQQLQQQRRQQQQQQQQQGRFPSFTTTTATSSIHPPLLLPANMVTPSPPPQTSSGPNALPTRTAAWAAPLPSSPEDHRRQQDDQVNSPLHQSPSPLSPISPLQQHSPLHHSPFQTAANSPPLLEWAIPAQPQQPQDLSFMPDPSMIGFNSFAPNGFLPPTTALEYMPATTQAAFDAATTLPMESAFTSMSPIEDPSTQMMPWNMGTANWQDFGEAPAPLYQPDGLPRMNMGSQSPTGSYLEILSQPSSGSENEWTLVNNLCPNTFDTFPQVPAANQVIFNPSQTLHLRSSSDASHSDGARSTHSFELGSYEEVNFPYSPYSPGSDSCLDSVASHRGCGVPGSSPVHSHHEMVSPSAIVPPMAIKADRGSSGSGTSSPPNRRNSGGIRKSPTAKNTKQVIRRSSSGRKDGSGEKKVGRRRGPLLPEQRKQASEIRKLRACLRCKFLKKTCDKGEPCAGCQPSHARLWQVPCTRIDIKDIGYFMKDWKADYERHLDRGVSIYNVKGFGSRETTMWITHGYGAVLPVPVREVYVADERCFEVDWVESFHKDQDPIDFLARTEHLDVGTDGVSHAVLSEYLDKHIDEYFEKFITDHFEGTPFITDLLKTAHRYYLKERSPIIRKALKLVLAYNLTLHITMVEAPGAEEMVSGQIDDEESKYFGKTLAPVMVNFQIKCAMADMWRELQKEVLEELSALYSSVYSGDRLKNWPTIFMLASILLAVWEEMQFDCHYRVPDPEMVKKFCTDMETTPVGVIVGLFHAISQKLPAFTEWDTRRHGQILNNAPAICEAMTEVRGHVLRHEQYLRTRNEAKFDRYDFDCLSNKFLSKLVIRAN